MGVSILLEMARLFASLYSSSRSHPAYSLVFLLSGGGKINFAGTKRWLEEHLDMDHQRPLGQRRLRPLPRLRRQHQPPETACVKTPKRGLARRSLPSPPELCVKRAVW